MQSYVNGEPGTSKDDERRGSVPSAGSASKKGSKTSDFLHFLYNPVTKEVCGRSGMSWLKISTFYIVLYAALCGFFAVCVAVFLKVCIEDSQPRLLGYDSMLQLNPALGFRPQPDVETTFIRLTRNGSNQEYVKDLKEFLSSYENQAGLEDCEQQNVTANKARACLFNMTRIPDFCTSEKQFGFAQGQPCILIKMNRIFGWLPAFQENGSGWEDVKMSCHGVNDADRENIGSLQYYPNQYFPGRYYPFLRQTGYLSPFIMVHFSNVTLHTLIMVSCRVNSTSIRYDPVYQEGAVRFELLVD